MLKVCSQLPCVSADLHVTIAYIKIDNCLYKDIIAYIKIDRI